MLRPARSKLNDEDNMIPKFLFFDTFLNRQTNFKTMFSALSVNEC